MSKTEISSAAEEEAGGASLFGLGRCLGGMKGGESRQRVTLHRTVEVGAVEAW